jgi:succinate dehydrogenase / fumarate reductase flavoprotein subunit
MARSERSLNKALKRIPALREEFWQDAKILGENESLNTSLEQAGRVADFLEFGELMCLDALTRNESCGGHFREEFQTADGEAQRNDTDYAHVAAWEYQGYGQTPKRHIEPLIYEEVKLATRSYK